VIFSQLYKLTGMTLIGVLLSACSGSDDIDEPVSSGETPVPVATITPTVTPVPTSTPITVSTPTPAPTSTPITVGTPTPVPTSTPITVGTPTPVPTSTPITVGTPTPAPTSTPVTVSTPTPVATPDGPSEDTSIQLSLVDYIDQYMGTSLITSNCTIENACADTVAGYINNGFSTSSVVPVSEEERLERVTKGSAFYTDPTVNCIVCHGNDGTKSVGTGQSLENCDVCGTWEGLRDYIDLLMPQAGSSSETGPFICTTENGCASATADWIWNTVNNWTLTATGGERIETEDRYGQDTLRLKSYTMIAADFTRIFGSVPANFAASATAFNASPEYWYEEPELGAVSLNVLANSALQACESETLPAITQSALEASCTDWAQRMWLRNPTTDEVNSCVAVGMGDTVGLNDKERALFSCVSMMISLPSLTY